MAGKSGSIRGFAKWSMEGKDDKDNKVKKINLLSLVNPLINLWSK